jgi:three-Cys-motif partner protein
MLTRDCSGCKNASGNCHVPGDDGLPLQCVGPWVENKYFFLERYVDATRGARKKYTDRGNSVFIDMFAGPGRCVVQGEKREIEGGCLRVLNYGGTPFSEHHFMDIDETNINALKMRLKGFSNCQFEVGDANVLAADLRKTLLTKAYRYHFAYMDPFGPVGLKWSTIEALAELPHVDLLIHFPIGAIKRNVKQWLPLEKMTILDEFLGTRKWRNRHTELSGRGGPTVFLNILKEQLLSIGFPEEGVAMENVPMKAITIRNTVEVPLYLLVLASKREIAQRIWNDITRKMPDGQQTLF